MSKTNTFDEMCRAVGNLIDRVIKGQTEPLDEDLKQDIDIITGYIHQTKTKLCLG